MWITDRRFRVFLFVALSVLVETPSRAQITVAPGYTVKVVAEGLDGPEGLGAHGAGQIAVVEAIDEPGLQFTSATPRLTLVHPSGRRRTLASETGLLWIDVVRDPSRGYFVTMLGGNATPQTRGIRLVLPSGRVSPFLSANYHFTGIALDRETGDLYVSRVSPSSSIDRVEPDGTSSVFLANVRPEGVVVTRDRILLATLQYRPATAPTAFNQVVAINLDTGAETLIATNLGTLVGNIEVSDAGEIFVSDFKDGKIRRLTPDGTGTYTVSMLAEGLSTSSQRYPPNTPPYFGLSFNHLAFDPAGRLYVSDFGAGRLYVIDGLF
ncbi:MAG TPA: hypothetical protein VF789_22630 [Thermoanaerobaculia bacterium]